MSVLSAFRVTALPNKEINKGAFFEALGANAFAIVYDFSLRVTFLCVAAGIADDKVRAVERLIPGICFAEERCHELERCACTSAFSCYRSAESCEVPPMHDVFDNAPDNGFIALLFVPSSERELEEAKSHAEAMLSSKEVRETRSMPEPFSRRSAFSTQRELFTASEETAFLNCVLASMNNAVLTNGLAYKFFLLSPSADRYAREYITSRFLVLKEFASSPGFDEQARALCRARAFPLDTGYLANFLNFYGSSKLSYVVPTRSPDPASGIAIGTFMSGGVADSRFPVRISASTLNLGAIITGLPGSGKTRAAMAVIEGIRESMPAARTLVIAPTDEWDGFALAHGMCLVRPYADGVPINFFRCPAGLSRERFYESLALVIAAASNAGPYENPMVQCLLNAFRRTYSLTDNPDPVSVYDAIEESIMRFHAKKTNAGVKYTKHGENIRSSLEGLRAILSRPEYSLRDGLKVEDLAGKGAVFDVSEVSGEKKPYVYALLLNQLYAIAAGFDAKGDDELRLLICLEEAQTVLGSKDSAAIQDLKQRIQDFRKQGVALMLLAHNVTDIEQGVRRLCQTKLYLRQAPDVAAVAVNDLVFTYAEEKDVSLKLKLLDSRIGAFSYIVKQGPEKLAQDTIFIRTAEYSPKEGARGNPVVDYLRESGIRTPAIIRSQFNVSVDSSGEESKLQQSSCYVRLQHLGDEVFTHKIGAECAITQELIDGIDYVVQILDRRMRAIQEFKIKACPKINLRICAESIDVS